LAFVVSGKPCHDKSRDNGRPNGSALSRGKGLERGRTAGRLRAAGVQRPRLDQANGEAPQMSVAGTFLGGNPREVAGIGRTPRCATPFQPGELPSAMTQF